jgi:RNA polymerase sigma factor (sigma-70 family)
MKFDLNTILSAKAGNTTAIEQVLALSRQDLRRYAEHYCMMDDIEDAVQEALIITSRRIRQLRDAAAMSSWMFRIVKRECNRLRRGWRMLTNQEIDETILPVVTPESNELRVELGRVIVALPPHYREILLMRDIEGMSLQEISAQLRLELAATKSRLHRARATVREHFTSEIVDASAGVNA